MPLIDETFFASLEPEPICAQVPEAQQAAFTKITRLVNVRERSQKELRERLVRDGFDSQDASAAIARAVRCGLVDDARFGAMLVRSRVAQGKGRSGIESELLRNGVALQEIEGWPHEFFDESPQGEYERALELLRAKPPRAKNIQAAAVRKLVAKGYAYGVATDVARRFARESQGLLSDF